MKCSNNSNINNKNIKNKNNIIKKNIVYIHQHLSKKSQSEIVGLMIIVMMISFILLFALSYYLREPDDTLTPFKDETLASSLISAILRTTTDCNENQPTMKNLLIDCAKWKWSHSSITRCYDKQSGKTLNSCDFFANRTKYILDNTLVYWNRPYELIIIPPDGDFRIKSTMLVQIDNINETKRFRRVSTATQPLPIGTNMGSLNMMMCIGGKCPDLS